MARKSKKSKLWINPKSLLLQGQHHPSEQENRDIYKSRFLELANAVVGQKLPKAKKKGNRQK
jgi:hypothetical protein